MGSPDMCAKCIGWVYSDCFRPACLGGLSMGKPQVLVFGNPSKVLCAFGPFGVSARLDPREAKHLFEAKPKGAASFSLPEFMGGSLLGMSMSAVHEIYKYSLFWAVQSGSEQSGGSLEWLGFFFTNHSKLHGQKPC